MYALQEIIYICHSVGRLLCRLALTISLLSLLAFPTFGQSSAQAKSATCVGLQSQLASLDQNSHGSRLSSYTSAIKKQKRQISLVKRRLRSLRCSSGNESGVSHPSCRKLNSSLHDMDRNLRSLRNHVDRNGSSASRSGNSRKRIQRALKRHRCGQPERRVASLQPKGFFNRLLGRNKRNSSDQRRARRNSGDILDQFFAAPADAERRRQARLDRRDLQLQRRKSRHRRFLSPANKLRNHNTFKTVCVRRCDGYYFPVSFSTDQSGLDRDASACSNMCPGADTELFTHNTSTETAEQMVSIVDGTLYTDLANAFAHREKFDPKCTCNYSLVKRNYNIDIPDSVVQEKLTNSFNMIKQTPLPSWRKPSTRERVKDSKQNRKLVQDTTPRAKRRVRVIGEAFLATQ